MSDEPKYHGHMTMSDGRHVPLTEEAAKEIMAQVDANEARLVAEMPDEASALKRMFDGWYRLTRLGWSEAIYCPKDGSLFEVIEAGSTGIHTCHYEGEWPKGTWWVHGAGDLWPSRPILFRPIAKAEGAK